MNKLTPCMTPCSHIHCAVPPHMLETIRLRGNAKQRKMAESLLTVSQNTRQVRQSSVSSKQPKKVKIPTQAVIDQKASAPKAVGFPVQREVYDGQNTSASPGTLVRKEGGPKVKDQDVNRAYDGAGDTYNLYLDVFQRYSLDGHGMKLVSTVHHEKDYSNAFWSGSQMVYGDGDGKIFNSFTSSLSVIAHELSHGMVQFSGGLVYQDQSGALNESVADVFGALTLQYKKRQQVHEASWLIGEGILAPGIQGVAIRSLGAPGTAYNDPLLGKDPQPYHMNYYVLTTADDGGVHINSGIPNHAFYLLAQSLGGYAWQRAGHIWYHTMQSINNPMATFWEWAVQTVIVAQYIYGIGSIEEQATRYSWRAVGLNV